MLLDSSGEMTPERMKGQSQSEQCLVSDVTVVDVKSNAVRNNTAQKPGMLGP